MIHQILDILLHLDVHLAQWSATLGVWTYLLLFLIIFAETGLVVTPFLPGDSLLFAAGALATLEGSEVSIGFLWVTLMIAAFTGDNTNYGIGRVVGPRVFSVQNSVLFSPRNLEKTQGFYQKYGSRAVILARFLPIFRTFIPFVAGVGKMNYRRFLIYSLIGSTLWMSSFLGAGYFFGNIPSVKSNFHIVIFAVIGISLVPLLIGVIKARRTAK